MTTSACSILKASPEILTAAVRPFHKRAKDWLVDAILRVVIRVALLLPYALRVRFFGWLVAKVLGPASGFRRAALENLALVWPDRSPHEHRRIATGCLENAGRAFIENYSAREFAARLAANSLEGSGWPALQKAVAESRPAILVTGHIGNYEAVRAALAGRGLCVGGLYREMTNKYFNAHYVGTLQRYGGPIFPQGRRGTAGFVRHLKSGGQVVLLFDRRVRGAPMLDFLGHPARTALSAADLALRYGADLIPFYGIRQPDGLSFKTVLEAPVPHTDAETMTQILNDSLAARIEADPDQWFWVHRRWLP